MALGDIIALGSADQFRVDASGNVTAAGTIAPTGAITAPSVTTTGAAVVGTWLTTGVTPVAMDDAAHALVLGTAAANQTRLVGNVVVVDPESGGASETLTLPPEASCAGMILVILNSGGEGVVVASDAPATVITLDTAQSGIVACDGTTWRGFMGAIT